GEAAPAAGRTERAPESVGAKPPKPVEARSSRPEPRRRDDDDGPKVKGLGDHVPAFLMRPVRVG
ncbi:MAG: DEAD/DEAH box helicase, partial [Bosea sp. (in: a-proteobacteria)]|nr:DEAD/DEAH box helicase [Bosea sp. (in: a-proteobacteria)]